MATIGLDNLYYSVITDGANGETYAAPVSAAKAISADLSINIAQAVLYADDGAAESVKEFQGGTISLGVADLGSAVAAALIGGTVDSKGVLVSRAEDVAPYVAIGFRARRSNGKYEYYWLYRVQFGIPGANFATKGDGINYSTPKIEGTVFRRNKPDTQSKHPWKTSIIEGESGADATTVTGWFGTVYEPAYPSAGN